MEEVQNKKNKSDYSELERLQIEKLEEEKKQRKWNVFSSLVSFIISFSCVSILFLEYNQRAQLYGSDSFTRFNFQQANSVKTNFSDIVGLEDVKEELRGLLEMIQDPDFSEELIPRGHLFIGPPGTGKTAVAWAFVGESGLPCFFLEASRLEEKFVGMGAKRLDDFFQQVKRESEKQNKYVIVFINELDSVGRNRKNTGTNAESTTTNFLLTTLDKIKYEKLKIIIIADTNLIEKLDPSLKRAGRFDKHIYFNFPEQEERKKLFDFYIKKFEWEVSPELLEVLASQTNFFSPASIENVVKKTLSEVIRKRKKNSSLKNSLKLLVEEDFAKYLSEEEKVINEVKKTETENEEEKHIINKNVLTQIFDLLRSGQN